MVELPQSYPPGLDKQKLADLMKRYELEGVLLTSPENVFYTTGYTSLPSSGNPILYTLRNRLPFFSYVNSEGRITLLCWGFSTEGVDFGVDDIVGFDDFSGAIEAIRSLLSRSLDSRAKLGIESSCPYYLLKLFEETEGLCNNLVSVDDMLASLRLIKSEEEISLIRESTEIIEKTVSELYDTIYQGMSRLDLIQEAKYRMIKNGATGISHVTFSFAQENPEIAVDERLGTDRLLTLDLGGICNGYCSDNRRYAYSGHVPDSLLERYNTMVEIVDEVGNALIPGNSYAEIFQLALDLYAKHNIELLGRFNHVGHNIGLETEEQWLEDNDDRMVEEGMVINIELYSTAETGEQIGNEETYVVNKAGPRRISVLPREIKTI